MTVGLRTAAVPAVPDPNELVEAHLALVQQVLFQIASHFPRHADRAELTQAAMLGLMEAAVRYDGDRGVPFERWAALRIRGAILDAVRAVDFAPRSVRAGARRVEQAQQALTAELGRTPTAAEVAARAGYTTAEVAEIESRVHRSLVLSLDAAVGGDGDGDATVTTLGESVTVVGDSDPVELLEQRELAGYVDAALELLPDRLRTVVVGYFVEGRTSAQLAAELGVTESRVSQLRTEGLAMLRRGIEAQYDPAAAQRDPARRTAARDAAYAAAIAASSPFRSRVAARTRRAG